MKRLLIVLLLISLLLPSVPTNADIQTSTKVRSVVIFVHGQLSGPAAYADWVSGAPFGGRWDSEVWILQMNWGSLGPASILDYSSGIGTRFERIDFDRPGDDRIGWGGLGALPWDGVTKLQQLVARIRLLLGDDVTITAIGHSTGTNIILAALQEGLRIDNFILMGSPISNVAAAACAFNTRFDIASRQVSGMIVNFHSSGDQTAQLGAGFEARPGTGLGYNGLSRGVCNFRHTPDNIVDFNVSNEIHNHFEWWSDWIATSVHQGTVANVLRGSRDTIGVTPDTAKAFAVLQRYARKDRERWFENGPSHLKVLELFLLPGAEMGLYFFKQREMQYTITCQQGMVRSVIRRELDGRWRKVTPPTFASSLTETRTGSYETERRNFLLFHARQRATLQTQVTALGSTIAVCTLVVTASG